MESSYDINITIKSNNPLRPTSVNLDKEQISLKEVVTILEELVKDINRKQLTKYFD